MRVTINKVDFVDQEKLFQDVKESFVRFINEYRRKHWFKEFIYQLTGGEDLVNLDRIKAKMWYWKLVITLKSLRVSLKFYTPSKEQLEELLVSLNEFRIKLEEMP